MKEFAARENAAVRKTWDTTKTSKRTTQVDWDLDDADFDSKLVPRVMSCLREGLGVEDMNANGTCNADEARQVISWMRRNGSLANFYRRDFNA